MESFGGGGERRRSGRKWSWEDEARVGSAEIDEW